MRGLIRWTLYGLGVLAVVAGLFGGYQWLTWPDVAALATAPPRSTAFIDRYLERERRAGREPALHWRWVSYDRISPHLKRAVLVAEDINFFSHNGFESGEMKAAVHEAMAERELPRGASTITQQLAKNLWLSPSRNPWRKVKEALLTIRLEAVLGKRRILELYLNCVELGPGTYGAAAAARMYFGKPASQLSEREAALLAASLSRPSSWHPGSSSRAYQRQVERILQRMERASWLWKVI